MKEWLAIASIIKCEWGIGMMAIPYMLQQAGLYVGIIQFLISMCLTADSIMRLLAVKAAVIERTRSASAELGPPADMLLAQPHGALLNEGLSEPLVSVEDAAGGSAKDVAADGLPAQPGSTSQDLDYAGTIRDVLGPRAEVLLLFSIVVSSYGSNIAYILYIAENCTRFLPQSGLQEWQWASLCLVPWLFLAAADNVDFLAPYGVVGLACAIGFEAVIVYDAATTLDWDAVGSWLQSTPIVQPSTLPIAVAIAAFCNEGVVIMALNVQAEMVSARLG
jgi:amino acid permease|eukprot:4115991-Prymnesium_polylepis.2